MSYLVLARKWRPKSFDALVGQEHVVRALTHALEEGRLHHAYLFTGTRGVGKTTIARIFAKALNCAHGVTAKPCGACTPCVEIDAGRFIDYVEMDAASNRGVEDIAALLEKAAYAPNSGRYKVYMIDEVHQLSGHAFNAMLKTLEEPPEHVKFILATTDPQKIPVTVLSRCLQFNLKHLPPSLIQEHLGRVLAAEGISFEASALAQLAKAAAGSMRDALSLLDQAIAHGGGCVREADVRAMLGVADEERLFAMLSALAEGKAAALLAIAQEMESTSYDFGLALNELATLLHRIALMQFAPEAIIDPVEREKLAPYARRFDAETLQLYYQIVVHGRKELPLAPDEASGFSMTLLRLLAFRPEDAQRGEKSADVKTPCRPEGSQQGAEEGMMPANAQFAPAPEEATQTSATPEDAGGGDWHALVGRLGLSGTARQLANHCELVERVGDRIVLRLSPAHKFLAGKLQQDKLREALSHYLGVPISLDIQLAKPQGTTPAEQRRKEQEARQEKAIAAIEGDPFVAEVCDLFDAEIIDSTIKPVE
ncbi:MAG: DNA polymerase III subunit gamma/tau [Rhodocyclaceae bacterium]|nr:DNA polymerase III subunit gamma/tau [Rhodocyclaceae bacterium]